MSVSIYTTRAMAAAMRQDKKTGNWLLDTFFSKVDPVIADTVDIDIIKGKRRMAPFQSPKIEGQIVEKMGFSTNTYKPAYIKIKDELSASSVVENRVAGESIYSLMSAEEREKILLAEQLNDFEQMIVRREVWMGAQQLINGYVDVVGKGVNYRIDLLMESSHKITLTGTDMWTDKTNSDPDADIADGIRLIQKDAGISANIIVGNSATMEVYTSHPKVKDSLNTRRIETGLINPKDLGEGVSYYGDRIIAGKVIAVYGYDDWAEDENGDEQPMFADGRVIVSSTNADARRHYGAIKDKKAGYVAIPRFPKIWEVEDPSATWLMVQSAPLPAFHQIDAIVSMKVF